MTIEEFNKMGFHANMWVMYKGEKHYMISLSFPEALFGLVPRKEDYPPDEWSWVRCENCELIKENK